MATITYTDIENGEEGLSVRTKINSFNNSAAANINLNTNDITDVKIDINNLKNDVFTLKSTTLTNTTDISTNNDSINTLNNVNVVTKINSATLTNIEKVILIDATSNDVVITLPAPNVMTTVFNIKRIDNSANVVTINSTDGIDTVNSITLTSMDNVSLVSDKLTQYYIL